MINVLDLGMIPGDPDFDNTPYFDFAMRQSDRDIYIPPGNYYFLTPPNPITGIVNISGQSMSNSVLVRKYQPAGEWDSFITLFGPGASRIENLSLLTDKSVDNGIALTLNALVTGESPDYSSIVNVNISHNGNENGKGTWKRAMWLHGAARNDNSEGKSIGLRDLRIENVYLFASTDSCLEINSVHDAYLMLSCYPAGGTGVTDLIKVNSYGVAKCNNIICNIRTEAELSIVSNTLEKSVFVATSYASTYSVPTVKFL